MTKRIVGSISLLLLIAVTAHAQQADTDTDEVIVIKDLTKSQLQEQIVAVETDFYRIFNANNDDDEFDIECRRETATGTHFSQRVCEPRFLRRARMKNNRDRVAGTDVLITAEALNQQFSDEFSKLNEAFARMIRDDKIFAEVAGILNALQTRLAEMPK